MELWEILVPTVRNDGRPFRLRYHRIWDKMVRDITGGLTIVHPIKGQWVDPDSQVLFSERMIPVRIACTEEQIRKIIDITIKYYDQLAVMAYRVSEKVFIVSREPPKSKQEARDYLVKLGTHNKDGSLHENYK